MRDWNRRRPSPGLIVAVVALVVALVGTAAALPGRNTVNSGDIIDGKVKGKDQKQNQRTEWALINASNTGGIIKSSRGVSLADVGDGFAYIDFGHNIAGRALVAQTKYPNGPAATEVTLCGTSPSREDETCAVPGTDNHNHAFFRVEGNPAGDVYFAVLPKG